MTDGDRLRTRTCIVIPTSRGGGAEFVALTWAEALREKGHLVDVWYTHQANEEDDLSGRRTPSTFGGRVHALRRHLRRFQPNTVLAFMPYANIVSLIAVRTCAMAWRPRVLISLRNIASALISVNGWRFRSLELLGKVLYRYADGCVAISHPVAAEAVSAYGLPSDKVWVVPNPALAKASPGGGEAGEVKVVEPDHPLELVVPARLVEQKRPLLALQVRAELEARGFNVGLTYFGSGPLERAIRQQDADGVVNFAGWDEHWFDHVSSGAVVLLPSLAEGFGNVLVEAASRGVPSVVSSRCLGASDAVVPGVTGVLVAGDDAVSYADGVERAAILRGIVAPQGWLERFSVQGSLRVLEQALFDGGPRRVRSR